MITELLPRWVGVSQTAGAVPHTPAIITRIDGTSVRVKCRATVLHTSKQMYAPGQVTTCSEQWTMYKEKKNICEKIRIYNISHSGNKYHQYIIHQAEAINMADRVRSEKQIGHKMPRNKQVRLHVPHGAKKSVGDPGLRVSIVVLISRVVHVVGRGTISIVHQRTCNIRSTPTKGTTKPKERRGQSQRHWTGEEFGYACLRLYVEVCSASAKVNYWIETL